MRLRFYEALVLMNLVTFSLLRMSLGVSGFNWYGLNDITGRFIQAAFYCLLIWWGYWAVQSFLGRSFDYGKLRSILSDTIPVRESAFVFIMFFSYWSFVGMVNGDKLDLIHAVNPQDRDSLLIAADQMLLGFQPAQILQSMISPRVTLSMSLIYVVAYLPLLIIMLSLLHRRAPEREKELFMTSVVVAYTLARISFFIIPAVGPETTLDYSDVFGGPSVSLGGSIIDAVRAIDSTQRNAFPSLHVAFSAIFLLFAKRLKGWERSIITLAVVVMWFSTLYLRFHYFVDILGGIVLAVFAVWAAPKTVDLWSGKGRTPSKSEA
jgi:membrane-associated phospholipid phosphatase